MSEQATPTAPTNPFDNQNADTGKKSKKDKKSGDTAKAKKSKPKRKKDGTVADFGKGAEGVRAFNERDHDTDTVRINGKEETVPVATFRSATGHNDDKNVGGVNQ